VHARYFICAPGGKFNLEYIGFDETRTDGGLAFLGIARSVLGLLPVGGVDGFLRAHTWSMDLRNVEVYRVCDRCANERAEQQDNTISSFFTLYILPFYIRSFHFVATVDSSLSYVHLTPSLTMHFRLHRDMNSYGI
jgi:hypothetical protein